MTTRAERPQTAIDAIADRFVEGITAANPFFAQVTGISAPERALPDYSPDGYAEQSDLRSSCLDQLARAVVVDETDAVTRRSLQERLTATELLYQEGFHEMSVNVVDGPLREIRELLQQPAKRERPNRDLILRRLAGVPEALAQYQMSLERAAAHGHVVAARQILLAIQRCRDLGSQKGVVHQVARAVNGAARTSGEYDGSITAAASAASAALDELRRFFRLNLLPKAPAHDSVGRERYTMLSAYHLAKKVDLAEAYHWAVDLQRDNEEWMGRIASEVSPSATVDEAIVELDQDPSTLLFGAEQLRNWVTQSAHAATDRLAGTHFDIPDELRGVQCCLADGAPGQFYTPPTGLTDVGRIWWGVPAGLDVFRRWQLLSVVHHEGVPGHHLQLGIARSPSVATNLWRRHASGSAGHQEGWAHYAEGLMHELGMLGWPAEVLGWLDQVSLRIARVVIDIGVHCDLPAPREVGGGRWTFGKAQTYLGRYCRLPRRSLDWELDRYLGWPGQAPAFKLGEREWRSIRQDLATPGSASALQEFHRRALAVGSVSLPELRRQLMRSE